MNKVVRDLNIVAMRKSTSFNIRSDSISINNSLATSPIFKPSLESNIKVDYEFMLKLYNDNYQTLMILTNNYQGRV